ncbi:MAG: HNH endonuclease [Treponema sp.]|nr:HNH endonuclease [Treponema sp.]
MSNYYLIPMDFLTCNFARLINEWNRTKCVMWEAGGTPDKRSGKIKKGSRAAYLQKGDIIYFYVCNLPTGTGESLSRILLRGEIGEEPKPCTTEEIYPEFDSNGKQIRGVSDGEKRLIGFSIKNLTTLPKELLKDDRVFCLEHMRRKEEYWGCKYNGDKEFIIPHGKTWPSLENRTFSEGLIKDLEEAFVGSKEELKTLIAHFNQTCFFDEKEGFGPRSNHKTFLRRTGTTYYEVHHFIQQKSGRKDKALAEIIDAPENKICLCSRCHNMIHYGQEKDVKEMIKALWCDKEFQDMLQKSKQSEKITLEWVQDLYIK